MAKNTTTIIEKISPQLEALQGTVATSVSNQLSSSPQTSFGGELIADPNATQFQALSSRENIASELSSLDFGGQVQNLASQTLAGDFLSADSNPFLRSAIEGATRPITDRLLQEILPSIRSSAESQGAFSNERRGILEGTAIGQTNRAALDISAALSNDNFARERLLQTQAPGLFQQGVDISLLPSNILGGVGDVRQGFAQANIDDAFAQFQESQVGGFRPAQAAANIASGLQGGSTTTTTSDIAQRSTGSKVVGALAGAAGGALAGAEWGGTVLGVPGAVVGGIIGGLVGLFG